MARVLAVVLLILLTLIIFQLMRRGWRNRERRIVINDLPALPPGSDTPPTASGVYVSTTLTGMPYERVVTRGLGVKSEVDVHVRPDGVVLERRGAPSLFIPRGDLRGVTTTGGMIGKFAAADSIVVFTWLAGDTTVDTGVHIRGGEDRARLLHATSDLIDPEPNESRDS